MRHRFCHIESVTSAPLLLAVLLLTSPYAQPRVQVKSGGLYSETNLALKFSTVSQPRCKYVNNQNVTTITK